MKRHWGDIPVETDTDSGIAALEHEQMTKLRPMEVEGPRLHQPSSRHYPPSAEPYPAEHFALDSVTAHTIQLLQHARKVRQLISSYQQTLENAKTSEVEPPPASLPPPIPEFDGPLPRHVMQGPVPFLPLTTDSDFARGVGKPPPEIDGASCRRLLRRSVAAILAHAGYEISPESLLDTLTDLSQEYIMQMCGLMRRAVDSEAKHGTTGFQDVMEQVFHEMGVGSTTALYDFYQTRIVNYHQHMQQQCEQLMVDYERLSNPELRAEEIKRERMKEEFLDIQFPSSEDSEENLDPEAMVQLEGLGGFEVGIVQEGGGLNSEEDSRWQGGSKAESQEPKMASMDSSYEQSAGEDQNTSEPPNTPQLGSEAGDSITDPSSVPNTDMVSPPPLALKPAKMHKK